MAPEAALGRVAEVDAQSDVYSLGAILFEIATGSLPHTFKSYDDLLAQLTESPDPDPSTIDATVPAGLAGICRRALARDRETRTASVDGFAAELIDRFGKLPEEVEHLLAIVAIKQLCLKTKTRAINIRIAPGNDKPATG